MTKRNELPDLTVPTRASGAYIGIALVQFVGKFLRQIWPLLLLWIINPGQITGIFILLSVAVLSGISTAYAILAYYQFDFCIKDQSLQIRSGVIRRKEQSIPFERIQNIQIEEPALHRLFGVVRLKVETAGSKEEEGLIEALSPAIAGEIKRHIDQERTDRAAEVPGMDETATSAEVLSSLELADLLRIGLTRNHLRTALILLGFSIGFLEDIAQLLPDTYTMKWDQEIKRIFDWDPLVSAALFAVFTGVSMVITLVTSFFKFYRQTLISNGDRWTVRSGLISRREWVIPVSKIQEISFADNPFQRWMKIGELRIKTASANEVGDEQVIRLSGVPHALLDNLASRIGNTVQSDTRKITPEAAFRWRLWLFSGILPGMIILFIQLIPLWLRILLMAIYWAFSFWWTGLLFRSYLFEESDDLLRIRRGVAWRRDNFTLWKKMQAVQLAQGIYEQRKDLATIVFSHGAGVVSFPFLKKQRVLDIINRGLVTIEKSKSGWI